MAMSMAGPLPLLAGDAAGTTAALCWAAAAGAADLPGFADFDGLAGLFLDMVDLGSGGFGDNRPCMTKMRMARAQARVPMESRRAAATATLKQARRQIDGALSRDRGRLLGLWSRWNARPADAPA